MSCCSSVFFGTNRMFRCCIAMQMASASLVSFLPAHEWLHVLQGHDPYRMTELLELPLPIECACGSFDADQKRLQFPKNPKQLIASQPTREHLVSPPVNTMELENFLCQIDPDNLSLHGRPPSRTCCRHCGDHGRGAVHPIKWKANYGGLEVSDARRLKSLEDED
jgi:hypothetical protein